MVSPRRLVAMIAVLTLAAAACGGAAAPTPTPTRTPATPTPLAASISTPTPVPAAPRAAPTATAAPAPTVAATPSAGKPQPSGKLVVAVTSLLDENLDAHEMAGGYTPTMYDHLYDSLFYPREDGVLDVRFATAWQTAPDGMSYTFTIRTGAKFHDGTPITARDVAEGINRNVAINPVASLRARFDKAAVLSPTQVRLNAKQVDVSSLPYFYILPIDYISRLGDLDGKANTFAKAPIGSGPFKFKEQRLHESLSFSANAEYWGEGPFVREVEMRIIPESIVRVATLMAGETAIVDALAGVLAEQVENKRGLRIKRVLGTGACWIAFRDITDPNAPKDSPFLDKRVRQALNYAIDQEALNNSIWRKQFSPQHSIYFPGGFGWQPSPDPYPYDLEKAKRLMAEAGFPSGFSTTIYAAVSSSTPLSVETTEAVASMWEKIGVKAQYIRLESGTWAAKIRDRSLGPLWTMTWGRTNDDGGAKALGAFVRDGIYMQYFDAVTEGIAKRQGSIVDRKERAAVLEQLNRHILDNAFIVPLYDASVSYGLSDKVEEYKIPEFYPYMSALWTVKLKR